MKKALPRWLISGIVLLLLLAHTARLIHLPALDTLENYFYDVRLRLFTEDKQDERIVIVDIDERSLNELGHWPWGRDKLADLVQRLNTDYQAAVIGFDIVFAEADDSSGLPVLERLAQTSLGQNKAYRESLGRLRKDLDYDGRLAEQLRLSPSVLAYYFSNEAGAQRSGQLPAPAFPAGSFAQGPAQFTQWQNYGANLPRLQMAAGHAGFINPLEDADGLIRRVPMLVEFEGAYYPSLTLAMLRRLLGQTELETWAADARSRIEAIDLVTPRGALNIPIDKQAASLVPYRGPGRHFPYISASDVIHGRLDAQALRGRIFLVGTTAPGLNDLRATPVDAAYPGVEVHANLLAGILDGDLPAQPDYLQGAEFACLLLIGALLAWLLPRLTPLAATLLSLGLLSLLIGGNLAAWQYAHLALPLAASLALILILYGFNTAWALFVETRSKRQFTALFGQYVPPELVNEMARNPESYSMEGHNQELTVLFSDVRSFTSISEGLDPKALAHLMNAYLDAMTQEIQKQRGTLDKYIGDAIMAFWGAPLRSEDHACQAVLAALGMQKALRDLNRDFASRGWPSLQIGIGINTGTMTVGDMGSSIRRAYTVMGDAVNLGARLEGISKEYGVGIVVGEATVAQCPDIIFRELDRVQVKGKDVAVAIYEPLGQRSEILPEQMQALEKWQQVLTDYRGQNWAAALSGLRQLQSNEPECALYRTYQGRIQALQISPPETDWGGVWRFTSK